MNPDNLRSLADQPPERRREIARMGGKASGRTLAVKACTKSMDSESKVTEKDGDAAKEKKAEPLKFDLENRFDRIVRLTVNSSHMADAVLTPKGDAAMEQNRPKQTDQQATNAALAALAAAGNAFALGQLWEVNKGFVRRQLWQWYEKNQTVADSAGLSFEDLV